MRSELARSAHVRVAARDALTIRRPPAIKSHRNSSAWRYAARNVPSGGWTKLLQLSALSPLRCPASGDTTYAPIQTYREYSSRPCPRRDRGTAALRADGTRPASGRAEQPHRRTDRRNPLRLAG